jgi:hypothetical protein
MLLIFGINFLFGQDSISKKVDKSVDNTFNSGVFLENQTCVMNYAKSFELVINHRFGKINTGSKEAWGIYSPSNIRIGLNYSILEYLQVGIGTTKFNKQQDANVKLRLIQQTISGKIPVSVVYYGALVYDARDTKSFDYPNFKESHRFSYFHEILVSHKFCNFFNLQVAPMYTHYNIVETTNNSVQSSSGDTLAHRIRRNDNFGLSVLGKINITSTISFLFEYDKNFTKLIKETEVYKNPKPNIAIGFEKATAAHSFQLFVSTAEAITYQRNMVYNQNVFIGKGDKEWWFKSDLVIGFNITRIF